ncbi:dethiobiotin synthase [Myxosarcina sp. GI1]|uniref:dethiobiotin synthase n=1 Tax=Myxosarcina sp. GI1 TaxID=1541065 RepID=UPI00055A918B|nr:dethiobiotin synthase [Myxosarcina sp. GI1]
MNALLIAGTDTDVGKTFVTVSLAAYYQNWLDRTNRANSIGILKLAQTGVGDIELYQKLFGDSSKIVSQVALRFAKPLAPPIAAAAEGKNVDLNSIWQNLVSLRQQQDLVLVEALGGLGSPVTEELTIADLAASWRLPTVLIVPVKLGAIAQAVANVALARSSNIELKGIILNCNRPLQSEAEIADLTPIDLIQSLTQIPVIGILPYIQLEDTQKLAAVVANWDLELILPL